MGRNINEFMKKAILKNAKKDIPLYFEEFKDFWDNSLNNINEDDLYEIYKQTLIFKNWKDVFHNIGLQDFDNLVNELHEDINSSMFMAFLGLYRSAHMHMRSCIELSLQLLYFKDHPIEYYKWKSGNYTIKHQELSDYIKTHPLFNDMNKEIGILVDQITRDWKYFSKHIHGESPRFFQCEKGSSKTNSFDIGDFNSWKSNYLKCTYKINKLFLLFFKQNINTFPDNNRKLLVSILHADDQKLILND